MVAAVAGRAKKPKTSRKPAVALDRTFGPNLRRCREAAGLTQEELSFRAGLHPGYVGLLERAERNPSYEITMKLIGALGIEPDELYQGGAWIPPEVGREGRFVYEEPDGS